MSARRALVVVGIAASGCLLRSADIVSSFDDGGSSSGGNSGNTGSGGMQGGAMSAGTSSGGKSSGGSANGGSGSGGDAGSDSDGGTGGMASGGDSGSAGQGPGGTAGSGGQGGSAGSGGNGGGAGTAGTGGGGFCVGDFLHCDDFEDGNVSDWTSSGGTWTVVNDGSFVLEGGNGSEEIYVGQQSLTDQWVTAKVKLSNWGGASSSYRAGVIARHASSSSFYAFTMAGSQEFYLHRGTSNVGGASGTCGPIATALPVGQWITLTLSVTGSGNNVHIQTYANGDPVHDCTTTSGTIGNGQPGLISVGTDTSGHFDDFKVLQP